MSVSQQIDKFIAENGGNERDALNVALSRIERVKQATNVFPQEDIHLITECNEFHITKDVYGAAESGFTFALEIISNIIK